MLLFLLNYVSTHVYILVPFYMFPHFFSEVLMQLYRSFKLLQLKPFMIMTSKPQWVSHYNKPETDIKEICQQFSKFEGGKIELTKDADTGIATITINHTERKNALSGKLW